MNGLILRGGTWIYRRRVPERLQPILNLTEVKRTLSTRSKEEAQAKWPAVHADVERMFAEAARQPAPSPEAIGYRAVREHRYLGPRGEEGLDLHLTSMLERTDLPANERVIIEALLRRDEFREGMKDNPPLSVVVERYHAQRKLTPKSRLEFDGVLARFTRAVGGDLPVRSITPAHVRTFRDVMQTSPSSRGGVLSPATIRKNLNILKAVLSWARSEDIIESNPAERIGVQKVDHNTASGRLPYDADDLAKLFSPEAVQMRADRRPADYWLPWLALYTGARLEELGQLRVADVRVEEGIHYLAIEPGDGKRVKTKSSVRRVPVHPALIKLGLLEFVRGVREAGEERLFPDLKGSKLRSLTTAWSQRWARHARLECGIGDARKVFHSFRHLWKDEARSVMPEEHHDAITGHSSGSVGRGYGRGVPLRALAESMARVRFSLP